MKLINGTEMIDNSPNEKAGELAEAIFDDVVFLLDLEEKCITEDEDGGSCNTEFGQELFDGIFEQCMNYFERESIKPQPKEPIAYMYERPNGSAKLSFDRQPFNKEETQIKEIPLYRGE